MSKKHYSAEEVLACLDEDSDSPISTDDSDPEHDSDSDSYIDVVSLHPMDNPAASIRCVLHPGTNSPSLPDNTSPKLHNMDNLPLSSVSSENSSSPQSEQSSEPLFKMDNSTLASSVPSKRKRNINSSSSRNVKWKLADLSSHGYSESTLGEMLLVPPSFTLPQVQHSKVADFSSINRHSESTSNESVLVPPSFTVPVNSSLPHRNNPLATSTPVSDESSGELLEEIIEAFHEYTSTLSTTPQSLSPASITHISDTELHDDDFSISLPSDIDQNWQNVTTRKKKPSTRNISKNFSDITHISESSESEMFPEDLSPLSSSTDDHQPHFTKFEHFPVSTYSSSDSCDFTQESITRYRPNFTLAKIPFEQLCYFVRRYLKSVDRNPDKPEWPVNGMDKNQKRHFRRKVQDYKLKNNVLYHLHTYTEIVQGETIKRCTYFHFFVFV